MTAYDADALRYRRELYDRAMEVGWSHDQFETLWRQYDLIQRDFCRQMVRALLMKFEQRWV